MRSCLSTVNVALVRSAVVSRANPAFKSQFHTLVCGTAQLNINRVRELHSFGFWKNSASANIMEQNTTSEYFGMELHMFGSQVCVCVCVCCACLSVCLSVCLSFG